MLEHAENVHHLEVMKDPPERVESRKHENWPSIGSQGYVSHVSVWN